LAANVLPSGEVSSIPSTLVANICWKNSDNSRSRRLAAKSALGTTPDVGVVSDRFEPVAPPASLFCTSAVAASVKSASAALLFDTIDRLRMVQQTLTVAQIAPGMPSIQHERGPPARPVAGLRCGQLGPRAIVCEQPAPSPQATSARPPLMPSFKRSC
jgi:hypothetical protein